MHLVVLLPANVDDVKVSRMAATVGLAVTPLSGCYLRPGKQKGLILGYGAVDEQTIEIGVKRLNRELQKAGGTSTGWA
jgi:GntR family transcriptional regulator/MocR family aminotransferase